MIIIPQNLLLNCLQAQTNQNEFPVELISQDDGDAFVSSEILQGQRHHKNLVKGILTLSRKEIIYNTENWTAGTDVLILVYLKDDTASEDYKINNIQVKGWVRKNGLVEEREIQIIHLETEIQSRIKGLYETEVLRNKSILVIGVGSGGSSIAVEMAKAGVGKFTLIDGDRVEVSNLVRHVCGISDLGRYKTKAVRDLILEKNPEASVETYEENCNWLQISKLQELVRGADLVFCCTDNRESRMMANLASFKENRVSIYGGTFNRAYGGHVLRVIPNETMCYQCFIDLLPEKAEDQEISSQNQANNIAYADRPVAIEPGLASDIAPIANMCVKVGILELLRGTNTSLSSLYEDLSNAWYLWLNRREPNTEYGSLKPIDSGEGDDFRILAWYGITNEKNPDCPVCGDFIGINLEAKEVPSAEEIAAFAPDSEEGSSSD